MKKNDFSTMLTFSDKQGFLHIPIIICWEILSYSSNNVVLLTKTQIIAQWVIKTQLRVVMDESMQWD